MSKKSPKKAGDVRFRAWSVEETICLRERFANTTTRELAQILKRSEKSIEHKATELELKKTFAQRSAQSKKTALAQAKTAEEMAALGSLGGRIGGKARAESLTPAARKKIAQNAIQARWAAKSQKSR